MNSLAIRTVVLGLACVACSTTLVGQEKLQPPPQAALGLEQVAANMQRGAKYADAATEWASLIEAYPNTTSTVQWRHYLGVCYYQVGRYADAIASFERVLADKAATFDKKDESWLWCGISQFKLAAETKGAAGDEAPPQTTATSWAMSAANSFESLLRDFPQSPHADQAQYLAGESYWAAGEFDRAIRAYQAVVARGDKSKYLPEAIFALGTALEEQRKFPEAIGYYDQFLEKFPQHASATAVRFFKAQSLTQVAASKAAAGQIDEVKSACDQALALYQQVATAEGFKDRALAEYQIGYCLTQLERYPEAAAAFAQYAENYPEESLARSAIALAGKHYLTAGDAAAAEKILKPAVDQHPRDVALARELIRVYLETKRPAEARKLAETTWAACDQRDEESAPLLLAMGDAAFAIPETVADSAAPYLQLADAFPRHALAPKALYNAAYTYLVTQQGARAIELADRFEQLYPNDSYLADMREVRGEVLARDGKHAEAAQVYQDLIAKFPQHAKKDAWTVALGQSLAMGNDASTAEKTLAPVIEKLSGAERAAARFQLGTVQYQAKKFADAATTFAACLADDPKWPRSDEALLMAARSHAQAGQLPQAKELATRCLQDFPQSTVRDQVLYRLGEIGFESGQFAAAREFYAQLIAELPKSPLVPSALYGSGWSALQAKQDAEAVQSFSQLIASYPQHELVAEAIVARAIAHRNQGDLPAAVADFEAYLQTKPEADRAAKALYERGVTEVKAKSWDAAIATFEQLLEAKSPATQGDKVLYELAWAWREKGDTDKSLERFAQLAKEFPESPLAAEANFHQGEAAYAEELFPQAIALYTAGAQTASESELAEKIAYKLAFAHFRGGDYPAAEAAFRQQVEKFAAGPLSADALFMVGESLYRQKKHAEAVTAYSRAVPAVDAHPQTTQQVKWLSRLHGAQSANEAGQFEEAIRFVEPLAKSETNEGMMFEAALEYGQALKGLKRFAEAIPALERAAASLDKTGARARAMIGEVHFEQKDYESAIKELKRVVYGYGGLDADKTVRPWQAFAAYEIGRCYAVQIKDAATAQRTQYVAGAQEWFDYVVKNYPDEMGAEAKKQLDKVSKL